MDIKNIDTEMFKAAYRQGKKAFKKAVDDFNKKADPFMGEVKENAKKVLYEPKLEKLAKKHEAAVAAHEKSLNSYQKASERRDFSAEFVAKKEMEKNAQKIQDILQKYEAFRARQFYAQQAFEKLNG